MSCKKIDLNKYDIISSIGEGAISRIYLVEDKQTKQKYALKKIQKAEVEQQNILYQIFIEKLILNSLQSEVLLKLHGTTQDDDFLYLLIDYAEYGSLNDLMLQTEKLDIDIVQYISCQILNMLLFLRTNGIIHRDIKPDNILITKDYKLKLIDLGTCKILETEKNKELYENYCNIKKLYKQSDFESHKYENFANLPSFVGTANYIAPEILNNQEPSFGTDIWSFAVILYKLLTNKFPFQGQSSYHIFKQIQKREINYPKNIDKSVINILQKIFVIDQNKRLGNGAKDSKLDFETLIQKAFFKYDENVLKKFQNLQYFVEDKKLDKRKTNDTHNFQKHVYVLAKGLTKKYKNWFFYDTREIIIYTNKTLEYKNPNNGKIKGKIDLKNCKVKKENDYDFTIQTQNRIYYFRSINELSDYWIQLISKINNQFQQ